MSSPVLTEESSLPSEAINTNNTQVSTPSASSPPLPLIGFIGVLIFYLYLSTQYTPKEQTMLNLKLLILIAVPVFLFFFMRPNGASGSWYSFRRPEADSLYRPGVSPWGVALVLVLLFFLLSYHPSLASN